MRFRFPMLGRPWIRWKQNCSEILQCHRWEHLNSEVRWLKSHERKYSAKFRLPQGAIWVGRISTSKRDFFVASSHFSFFFIISFLPCATTGQNKSIVGWDHFPLAGESKSSPGFNSFPSPEKLALFLGGTSASTWHWSSFGYFFSLILLPWKKIYIYISLFVHIPDNEIFCCSTSYASYWFQDKMPDGSGCTSYSPF